MKAAIVVPTIREECIIKFLDVWNDEFNGHTVIVVEDNPEPSLIYRDLMSNTTVGGISMQN